MIYLFESELPENKSIIFTLIHVYGIGKFNSGLICKKLGFSRNLKIKNLSEEQTYKLIKIVKLSNIKLASDLKKLNLFVTKRLISIKSFRGLRKNQGLPIRGQRTHTNAKTSRKRR